jgi:hypothetical protein
MNLQLKNITLPEFGIPEDFPVIPNHIYEERCAKAYRAANSEWFVVYGDREHSANMNYLSGFDPRFEEALLILGPKGAKYLLVGNEGKDYTSVVRIKAEIVLCQTFSLLGQDRTLSPRLDVILQDIGIKKGSHVAVCGWKYVEENEGVVGSVNLYAPAAIVDAIATVTDLPVKNATHVLMHPANGLRSYNEVEQIAALEWGAARASAAVLGIINGVKPGMTEFQAVSNMNYQGEPLSCHVMFSAGKEKIVGLSSPTSRVIAKGDAAFTAIGYWGGLSCRAGMIDTANDDFLSKFAKPYMKAIFTWYQMATIGVSGGHIYETITNVLAEAGLQPALNPGHLTSIDEWVHTFFCPQSKDVIRSGMGIQCDIIPTPVPDGVSVNNEDSVVFADERLRAQLKNRFPDVWERVELRRRFMQNELGLNLHDDLLPLSNNPAYYSPFWLSPGQVLTLG